MSAMNLILRLPPALRPLAYSQASVSGRTLYSLHATSRRAFAQSVRRLETTPPKAPPPKPRISSTPPAPRPRIHGLAVPKRKAPESSPLNYSDQLLNKKGSVQLFIAPVHTSFFILSYITGGLFCFGAYVFATLPAMGPDPTTPPSLYVVLPVNFAAFCLVVLGTTLLLAPWKIIRRIDLFRPTPNDKPKLRFFVKPPLAPLTNLGGGTFEAQLGEVARDRNIVSSATAVTQNVPEKNIDFGNGKVTYVSEKPSLFFRFRQNTAKAMVREGMAYIKIAGRHGLWKLDLHGGGLNRGEPLDRLFTLDPKIRRGLPGLVKSFTLRSKSR